MYATVEMRWFWPEQLPEPVNHWFQRETIAPEPEREDWYLSLPNHDDLGIKYREGQLEIKQRLTDRGMQTFGDRMIGHLEQWVKWSFTVDAAQKVLGDLVPSGMWVPVKKTRQQRTYEVLTDATATRRVRAIDSTKSVEHGCNLELAALGLHDQTWFSLCFEAFGRENAMEQNLRLVVQSVLADPNFPALPKENSLSYPQWLRELTLNKF